VDGKRIGDHQVGIYKKPRTKFGQEVAAAKSGISVRSGRRIDTSEALPSQREARKWRTRTDPFEAVWDSELVPMLAAAPGLTATTLLQEIQRRHPGQYDDALLRTLQRRVRTWGASYGKEREVFFAQAHPPGRLGLSDFTHAAVLQVTIAGAALLHLLYQFALAYCSVLRDALFPRTEYRQMWVQLKDCLPEAQACRLMVGLLDLAGNGGCEAALAQRLAVLLAAGAVPDLEELQQEMAPRPAQCPTVTVVLPTLASYDCLLGLHERHRGTPAADPQRAAAADDQTPVAQLGRAVEQRGLARRTLPHRSDGTRVGRERNAAPGTATRGVLKNQVQHLCCKVPPWRKSTNI
jgi:hypothetical protein